MAFPLALAADPPAPADRADRFAEDAFKIIDAICKYHVKRPAHADLVRWSVEGLYREASEPIPAGIAERVNRIALLDTAGIKSLLADARHGLKDHPGFGEYWDLFGAAAGIFRHLEPNSDPKSWLRLQDPIICVLYRRFHDLGLTLESDAANESVRVATPIYGGPAYRAGVRAGDRIVRVVEERPEGPLRETVTRGKPLEAVVDCLRGPDLAVFHLHLQRPDGRKEMVDVRPGQSEVETVLGIARGADDRWVFTMPHDPAIGYVRIKQFGPNTAKSLKEVLTTHPEVRGWVIDLRFNDGGFISSAIQTAELLVGTRRIMTIRPGRKGLPAINYDGDELAVINDRPIVCLVNGKTERTAELVPACLQDQGKALIVGERTAGRAEIRNIMPILEGKMVLGVTTAVYVRPNGKQLSRYMSAGRAEDDWGVSPDAGMTCHLSHDEADKITTAFRNAEAIYDPAFRPKTNFVDRQLDLALAAVRTRIERH